MRAPVALLLAAGLAWPLACPARVSQPTGYTRSQVFNAAVRFLRVDSGYKITEKDQDNGYLLFEYPRTSGSEPTSGSVEVVETEAGTSLVVQIPAMPEHHEQYVADGLVKKLRTDYGDPPARKREPEKEKPAPEPAPGKDSAPREGGPPSQDSSKEKRDDGMRDPRAPLPKLRTKDL